MPPRKDFGAPTFSLPRLSGVALAIVIANVVLSFLALLAQHAGAIGAVLELVLLRPVSVMHGLVWQLLTYSFFDLGALSLLFSSFALWSFGAMMESGWGTRRFAQLYFGSVIFAGLIAVGLSYTGFLGTSPDQQVSGAWGGVFGLLGAFGTAYAEQETFLFPFPTPIKAKWLAIIWIGVAVFMLLGSRHALFLAELGGALFGFIWAKFLLPSRGIGFHFSERYYGVRNRYYRWKRRRAARKFEVYMRKHDRSQYFDEYGNFKPPEHRDDEGKPNGEAKGPWAR